MDQQEITDLRNNLDAYNATIMELKASVDQLEQRDTGLIVNLNLYNQTIMEQKNTILQQVTTYADSMMSVISVSAAGAENVTKPVIGPN